LDRAAEAEELVPLGLQQLGDQVSCLNPDTGRDQRMIAQEQDLGALHGPYLESQGLQEDAHRSVPRYGQRISRSSFVARSIHDLTQASVFILYDPECILVIVVCT